MLDLTRSFVLGVGPLTDRLLDHYAMGRIIAVSNMIATSGRALLNEPVAS